MKIAICDDCAAHIDLIKPYIVEFFSMREMSIDISEFFSGGSFLDCEEDFDIIFIDIELGDTTGIYVAEQLKKRNAKAVIIAVTSFVQYLDDAMDLNFVRFLSKPVSQKKIYAALKRAMEIIDEKIISFSTKEGEWVRLNINDIVYIEAKLKEVAVYTARGTYFLREPLKNIKTILSSSFFAIPHNSFIVNMNYITRFKREEIILSFFNEEVIIHVSNRKQPQFRRRFMAFIGEGD